MNEKTQELVNKTKDLFKEYYKEGINGDDLRREINETLDGIKEWISDSQE